VTLTTSTITGRVPLPNDATPTSAEVVFTLSAWDAEGGDVIPPASIRAPLTATADLPDGFELWRNTEGLRGSHYIVTAYWKEAQRAGTVDRQVSLGVMQVGDDAEYALADLLAAGVDPATPSYWMSISEAQYADVISAVQSAEDAAALSEAARDASATASAASAAQSEVSRVYADASASAARSARDAAFVNANVFADIATGRAAVADGQQFQVVTGDEIIRYRRDSSSTQTEVARYPAGQTVVALDGALGQLAAILGQTYEEVDRLSAAQEGDVYTLRTLLEMISVVGQLADQINGGQVALRGGSLADPALRIGTAGIYSSAADTLSVAIAGVERLRVTASGITIYGTVTEA